MREEIPHKGVWIDNAQQTVGETVAVILAATGLARALLP